MIPTVEPSLEPSLEPSVEASGEARASAANAIARTTAIERAAVEAVAGFWAGVLGWPGGVVPAEHQGGAARGSSVVAVVGIGGDPGRIVRVTCDESLGVAAAQRAFGGDTVPPAADVDDTVKELANVVAGAVKAVADGATTMTLPMCARISDSGRPPASDSVVHERCWVASTGDRLVVEVVARCAGGGRP